MNLVRRLAFVNECGGPTSDDGVVAVICRRLRGAVVTDYRGRVDSLAL